MIALASAGTWLLKNWKIGVGIALLLALGIQTLRVGSLKDHLAAAGKMVEAERANHAVTRASVATLQAAIKDQNAAVARLASEGDARQKAAQEAQARAKRDQAAQAGTVARLRASAGRGGAVMGQCGVSDALADTRGL